MERKVEKENIFQKELCFLFCVKNKEISPLFIVINEQNGNQTVAKE